MTNGDFGPNTKQITKFISELTHIRWLRPQGQVNRKTIENAVAAHLERLSRFGAPTHVSIEISDESNKIQSIVRENSWLAATASTKHASILIEDTTILAARRSAWDIIRKVAKEAGREIAWKDAREAARDVVWQVAQKNVREAVHKTIRETIENPEWKTEVEDMEKNKERGS